MSGEAGQRKPNFDLPPIYTPASMILREGMALAQVKGVISLESSERAGEYILDMPYTEIEKAP